MKKLFNFQSSFLSINSAWQEKNSYNIDWNSHSGDKSLKNFSSNSINFHRFKSKTNGFFFWRKPWSSEKKLLIFKSSSKTFNQNTKAKSDCMYFLEAYVVFFHSSLLYQLISTNRNHCIAVNFQTPIIY